MADRSLAARTDSYFLKTKAIVGRFGDRPATYAVFMRRPVISAPRLALDFLEPEAAARGTRFEIELDHAESVWVGAGDPILHVTGPLFHLVDLETVLLQKLGPPCVAAYNAYAMCAELPKVAFLAMDARHCAGAEMAEMMAVANAPIDVIGTGSYLPELWSETYATADIIAYDGVPMVKAGREFLLRKR